VLPVTAADLAFETRVIPERSFAWGEDLSNDEAVRIWKRHSIAGLRERRAAPDGSPLQGPSEAADLVTAANTPLLLQTRPVADPRFTARENRGLGALLEWRHEGEAIGLMEASRALSKGIHALEAGPPGAPACYEVLTYEVELQATSAGVWEEDQLLTFVAQTDPPGWEEEIRWLAATKYGVAWPLLGRGPTFTTRFSGTFGPGTPGRGGFWQWLGVRADSAVLGQDQKADGFFVMSNDNGQEGDVIDVASTTPAASFGTDPLNLCAFVDDGTGGGSFMDPTAANDLTAQFAVGLAIPGSNPGVFEATVGVGTLVSLGDLDADLLGVGGRAWTANGGQRLQGNQNVINNTPDPDPACPPGVPTDSVFVSPLPQNGCIQFPYPAITWVPGMQVDSVLHVRNVAANVAIDLSCSFTVGSTLASQDFALKLADALNQMTLQAFLQTGVPFPVVFNVVDQDFKVTIVGDNIVKGAFVIRIRCL
jgi:hypothetical protein